MYGWVLEWLAYCVSEFSRCGRRGRGAAAGPSAEACCLSVGAYAWVSWKAWLARVAWGTGWHGHKRTEWLPSWQHSECWLIRRCLP
eukprot:357482-Chlamydomonas_euryale.AAC.2